MKVKQRNSCRERNRK